MAKETLGLKLDSQIVSKFKELQNTAGGTAQDFVEMLLATHIQTQIDEDTASPIYKEQIKVRQAFAQAERVANAFLELSAADKIAAEEQARDAIKAAQEKVVELNANIKMDAEQIKNLQEENKALFKQIAGLEETAESLAVVKQGFEDQRNALETKVADLTEKLAGVSDENIAFRKTIDTLKEELQKVSNEYEKAKTDYQISLKDLELDCQNRIHGLESKLNKDCEIKIQKQLSGTKQEIEQLRVEYEEKVKTAVQGQKEIADSRIAEIQSQLTLAIQKTDQLRIEHEEKIKAAVEAERVSADDRLNKIMGMFSLASEKSNKSVKE
ncbi:putative ATPase (plasmid) [Desulforapulum autotrophicum HRM2]|uniref:ATPase n=1 Tax=Desulforapulum autotrophicum (strain ATCC 43914 / DSM 3382 / VKM B-1955 / HRM2) TaxID=177437 RepID=C0QMS6_DESAH|nr:hypothetical protein [Desulforapulum autotrophicum]ACN18070.1 putative ATPase [Desulforapulum autotrophicum HRM2]